MIRNGLFVLGLFFFSLNSFAQPGKVLLILSSKTEVRLQGGKSYQSGYQLNEVAPPVFAFLSAGYEVEVATPDGKTPNLDPKSRQESKFASAQEYEAAINVLHLTSLKVPKSFQEIIENLSSYEAIYIPGYLTPMQDLFNNLELGKILSHFRENKKPTALLGHGPLALLSTKAIDPERPWALQEKMNQRWAYAGYSMTVLPESQDQAAEEHLLEGKLLFYPATALKSAGGRIVFTDESQTKAVVDRELITAQSAKAIGSLIEETIAQLAEKLVLSSVPEAPKTGTLTPGRLYDLSAPGTDWSEGKIEIIVEANASGKKLDEFAKYISETNKNRESRRTELGGWMVYFTGDLAIYVRNYVGDLPPVHKVNFDETHQVASKIYDANDFLKKHSAFPPPPILIELEKMTLIPNDELLKDYPWLSTQKNAARFLIEFVPVMIKEITEDFRKQNLSVELDELKLTQTIVKAVLRKDSALNRILQEHESSLKPKEYSLPYWKSSFESALDTLTRMKPGSEEYLTQAVLVMIYHHFLRPMSHKYYVENEGRMPDLFPKRGSGAAAALGDAFVNLIKGGCMFFTPLVVFSVPYVLLIRPAIPTMRYLRYRANYSSAKRLAERKIRKHKVLENACSQLLKPQKRENAA
ncbi:MAG: hypothetical protein AB7F43_12710 [Bacteriovoracia bacterium]